MSSSSSSSSAQAQESYTTGDDNQELIYGNNYQAQTFTPSANHDIARVRLKLAREQTTSYTLTVAIQGTDANGNPDGNTLASGTYDTANIGDSAGWHDIDLTSSASLTAGTQYAIVVSQDGQFADRVYWLYDSGDATYTGGERQESTDGGSTWTKDENSDFMFIEYGS